jgi:Ca2+-binding EF-hand superfamily protein
MLTTKHAAIALVVAAVGLCLLLLGGALAHADDLGVLAESMFDRLDTDHDGVITRDEVRAARGRLFDNIDADGDGVATLAEIEAAKNSAQQRRARRLASLTKLRAEMPPPSERLAALDQNKDGKVSREEFVSVSPWFDRIDRSGGRLSKADFASFLDASR